MTMTMKWTQENGRLWSTPAGYTITNGFHAGRPYTLRHEGTPLGGLPSLADAQRAAEGHADARLEAPLTRGPGDVEYAVPEHVGAVDAALSAQDRAEAQEQERQDREDVAQARLEELADTWPTPACPDVAAGKPHPTHRIEGTWREQCPGVESGDAADAPEVAAAEASLAARQAEALAKVDAVLDEAMAHVAHWQGVVSLASALRNSLAREAHHGLMSTLPAWAAPVVPQEASENLGAQQGSQADLRRWALELRKHGFSVMETPARRPGEFRPGDIVRVRRGITKYKVLHVRQANSGGTLVSVIAMNAPGAVPAFIDSEILSPWE